MTNPANKTVLITGAGGGFGRHMVRQFRAAGARFVLTDVSDAALAHAQEQGATLRICQACQVKGSHPHPEGWVAFLDEEAGGIEIQFMQVYTPEQLEEYAAYKGI